MYRYEGDIERVTVIRHETEIEIFEIHWRLNFSITAVSYNYPGTFCSWFLTLGSLCKVVWARQWETRIFDNKNFDRERVKFIARVSNKFILRLIVRNIFIVPCNHRKRKVFEILRQFSRIFFNPKKSQCLEKITAATFAKLLRIYWKQMEF